jgi:hypothetical protein
MADDYSEHPISLAEARADKAKDAALWKPRDAVLSVLRDIDSGAINLDHIIIIGATIDPGNDTAMTYRSSMPNAFYGVGMLQAAILDFLR